MERLATGIFRIGTVILDKSERSVSFPAEVNMNKGLLEYLLVRNGGKTHESLLRTATEPAELQMALLLLGLEGTSHPIASQGAHEVPTGEPVAITISVADKGGKISQILPESWLVKKSAEKMENPEQLKFVFTGSLISSGRFLAQVEGSMVSIFRDPAAIIDNVSAGGDSDRIWFVNEGAVPAVGTPVMVTIVSPR